MLTSLFSIAFAREFSDVASTHWAFNYISELVKEAKTWKDPETRPRAMRAMILYPLNALAEDQMVRLRKALDSKDVKSWLDSNCNKNRIYFGRYTGRTEGKNPANRNVRLVYCDGSRMTLDEIIDRFSDGYIIKVERKEGNYIGTSRIGRELPEISCRTRNA